MTFATPLEAITGLVAARDAGDIDEALACYTLLPTLVVQPGTVASGREAPRQVLENFDGRLREAERWRLAAVDRQSVRRLDSELTVGLSDFHRR
jgi:hypothetical protein